jgi:hypothetical protein
MNTVADADQAGRRMNVPTILSDRSEEATGRDRGDPAGGG